MNESGLKSDKDIRQLIRKVTIYGETRYVIDVIFDGIHYRFYSDLNRVATEDENIECVIAKASKRIKYERTLYFNKFPSQGTLEDYILYYLDGLFHLGSDMLKTDGIVNYDRNTGLKKFQSSFYKYSATAARDHCKYLLRHTIGLSKINRDIKTLTEDEINEFLLLVSQYYSKIHTEEVAHLIIDTLEQAKYVNRIDLDISAIKIPKESISKKRYFLDEEQYKEIIMICKDNLLPSTNLEAYMHMILIAIVLRCEPIDLVNLKVGDIRFQNNQVILPKGTIGFSEEQKGLLIDIMEERGMMAKEEQMPLFPKEKFSRDVRTSNFNKNLERIINKMFYFLGLPDLNFSDIHWSYIMIQKFKYGVSEDEIFKQRYIFKPAYEKCLKDYAEFKKEQEEW